MAELSIVRLLHATFAFSNFANSDTAKKLNSELDNLCSLWLNEISSLKEDKIYKEYVENELKSMSEERREYYKKTVRMELL